MDRGAGESQTLVVQIKPPQLQLIAAQLFPCNPQRIIKGRPFEVGFECDPELYRKEHPLWT